METIYPPTVTGAKWRRTFIHGAFSGLLSASAFMIGVGAIRQDAKSMILMGVVSFLTGSILMTIGEFISVSNQYDAELSLLIRENGSLDDWDPPRPISAAAASLFGVQIGASIPMIAAMIVREYEERMVLVVVVVSAAFVGFGRLMAAMGQSPPVRAVVRMLLGGWVTMGLLYGLAKLAAYEGYA